jgi:hypothetical protein
MKTFLLNTIFLLLVFFTFAQPTTKEYQAVDDAVKKLGSFDSLNMGTISNIVTKNFTTKELKVRAIYAWIANNITFDIKAYKSNDASKSSSADVLKYRKAIGAGYAALFQDMCSSAKIRCLTVDGFIKKNTEEINEKKPEINHTWAVVQLGQSPETWYYVDVCMGAGYLDKLEKNFIKAYDGSYFFSDKKIFNNQHYPDNEAWKLGAAPKNKKDFYELPITKKGTYYYGISAFAPASGIIKAKVGKPVQFNLVGSNISGILKIALQMVVNKKVIEKEMNFSATGSNISFTYTFNTDDEFPLTITLNDKETLQYLLIVEE